MERNASLLLLRFVAAAVLIVARTTIATAQSGHGHTAPPSTSGDQGLPAQLRDLRANVAKLEAALAGSCGGQATAATDTTAADTPMGAGGQPSGMGMMEQESMEMSGAGRGMSSMGGGRMLVAQPAQRWAVVA